MGGRLKPYLFLVTVKTAEWPVRPEGTILTWQKNLEFRHQMKSNEAEPPYETLEIGTPLDYTSDIYRVYFEVNDHNGKVMKILTDFLGEAKAAQILKLAHGYETEMPIQCVPDVVRLLCEENISIYQVVRYAKTGKT